ncbi:uncharacterized protein EDB91DRAFT_1103714 [Suillus paluster]|uniref:uncharacterized protein n=1 Tax=Suillus paluster TaxID=48578 RepID=UPI001B87538A|nr:uncharacterized protein EDB91DRAFT_1103714 [Suillus paluster]KAG1752658.1 hypothetical protein EDB91DRAFT_1103714 [Suillus paluster]
MHTPLSLFLLTLSLFSLPTSKANAPTELRLMHRVVHPNLPVTPWAELGTITLPPFESIQPIGSHVSFSLGESLHDDLAEFAEAVNPNMQGAMYHVTIDSDGPVSSTKACLLPSATSANIVIHLSVRGEPFAIDYAVSPVPRDGICPTTSTANYPAHNTSVVLKSPRMPPLPELRVPPPLTPEGEPVVPVPEKSFVQKYWIYLVVVLGALREFHCFLSCFSFLRRDVEALSSLTRLKPFLFLYSFLCCEIYADVLLAQ